MRAVVIRQPGDPDVLEVSNVPTPNPGRGEIRVRVRATAINRADILQRKGAYAAPEDCPPDIPGLEYAGEVDALGDGVDSLRVGDRVFGLVGGGSYAEYLLTHARTAVRTPEGISDAEAAAIPEAFVTAYDAMIDQAKLASGETVLIHAVGSGVGTAAVQIARAIGARCIGTARNPAKLSRAQCEGITARDGRFAAEVMRITKGRGVDVVLNLVGGSYIPEDLLSVATGGRIILAGLLAGSSCDLDLGAVLRKRITIRGTILRSRPLEEKILAARMLERNLVPLFATKQLHAVIDRVLPLDKASDAHRYMASNEAFGKVILDVG